MTAEHDTIPMEDEMEPQPQRGMAIIGNKQLATAQVGLTRDILNKALDERNLIGEYVSKAMVNGTDYGVIPGTGEKKTLLKPGAEKLVELFRCTAKFTFDSKIEDFATPLFHYSIRCRIIHRESGMVIAEGVGSANSKEAKWRWRDASPKCPSCGAEAIKKSKFPPRDNPQGVPGWYCFGKIGGCGAQFDHDDDSIAGQKVGRIENDDICTQTNTILKQAKKRSLVDAALALSRCSDLFTQDMDDDGEPTGGNRQQPQQEKPQQQPKPQDPPKTPNDAKLVEGLMKILEAINDEKQYMAACNLIWDNSPKITTGGRRKLLGYLLEQSRAKAEWEEAGKLIEAMKAEMPGDLLAELRDIAKRMYAQITPKKWANPAMNQAMTHLSECKNRGELDVVATGIDNNKSAFSESETKAIQDRIGELLKKLPA